MQNEIVFVPQPKNSFTKTAFCLLKALFWRNARFLPDIR